MMDSIFLKNMHFFHQSVLFNLWMPLHNQFWIVNDPTYPRSGARTILEFAQRIKIIERGLIFFKITIWIAPEQMC